MTCQHRFLIEAEVGLCSGKQIYSQGQNRITEQVWQDSRWRLQTPMREFLGAMDAARVSAQSNIESLLRYFCLVYVFTQGTSRFYAQEAELAFHKAPRFSWRVVCPDTGHCSTIQFPLCCVQIEVIFVGIKLARSLFASKRFQEAALVYHAIIGDSGFLSSYGQPDDALRFFLNGFRHESEFCLLVERIADLTDSSSEYMKSTGVAEWIFICNRLHQVVAESPLIDANYCHQLQMCLIRRLPAPLVRNISVAEEHVLVDIDSEEDEEDIVHSTDSADSSNAWFSYVLSRRSHRKILEMISSNVDEALCKHRNSDKRNKYECHKGNTP